MSEQSPDQPLQEELESQQASGYDPNSGFTYKQYLEQGGETGQELRQRIESEMTGQERDKPNRDITVRPVREGELEDDGGPNDKDNNDPNHEDYLPVGVMAHEPWTIDVVEKGEVPEPPIKPAPGEEPPEGLVEEPEPPEDEPGEPEEPSEPEEPEPPEDEEEPTATTPEGPLTSPELEEAQAEVAEAREELARLRAGRESSTFFSVKYSKKKVEAAFQRYEEAKAKAGEIAVNLLRERGVEGKELASAINWGSMVEVTDLIDKQYDIEQQAVESKRLRGFYDWWKKQSGIKGMIKKGLVTAAVGVPVGVGAAIVAAPLLAGAGLAAGGGAAVGASLARNVSKGLVGNTIRRNAEASSVAEEKRLSRTIEMKQLIDASEASDDAILDDNINHLARSDTKETKRSNDKRAYKAAAVGAGGALAGYMIAEGVMNWIDTSPTPPTPPGYDSAGADRMTGILTQRPGAEQDWLNLQEALPPDAVDADALRIDEIYNGVKDTLSPSENSVLNQAIGRLSATEGYGNAWTAQHMNDLIRLAQEGNSLDEIIAKV